MYRYYQVSEKSVWRSIEDEQEIEAKALSIGAKKLTILALSEVINDDTDRSKVKYSGPLYIDIDHKDIQEAIRSCTQLLHHLDDLEVPRGAVSIFASGGKGFHIIISADAFSANRPTQFLPHIYREMALELHVLGMDFQVYSMGRGVSWRLPNIERENGRYRVPVTADEVFNMEPQGYADITSTPRIIPLPAYTSGKIPSLVELYERAKKRVRSTPRPVRPVPDEDLTQFREEPPGCIRALVDYKVKSSFNFNECGFQLAIFIARAGVEDGAAATLISRMADNGDSAEYDTPRARAEHLQGLTRYLQSGVKDKKFSCAAMRSCVLHNPCDGCSLHAASSSGDSMLVETGIDERPTGYWEIGVKADRQISTFTLKPTDIFYETSQTGKVVRRVAICAELMRDGKRVTSHVFEEDGWITRTKFKMELKGLNSASFYGTDEHVQKIKQLICGDTGDMNEIIRVYAAGVHIHKIASRDVHVYVEPDASVNEVRIRGTHQLSGAVSNAPKLLTRAMPAPGDKSLNDALTDLFDINSPAVMGQVLGWLSACHLKTQFMSNRGEFPLLNLWGNAGSGKSMTAVLASLLGGCDYTGLGSAPKSMPSITNWALIHECSTTTTVPRILEEYNKSKIIQRLYDYAGEIMKAAWNGQVIARGRVGGSNANGAGLTGASVTSVPILSPLMVISEQAVQMPALQQRMVQVPLSHSSRTGKTEVFNRAYNNRYHLLDAALAMMVKSLGVTVSWIEEKIQYWDSLLPRELIERPRYAYIVVLSGLDFLENVLNELQLPVASHVDALRQGVLGSIAEKAESLAVDKHRTEVDVVLEHLGVMCSLVKSNGEKYLKPKKNYWKDDFYLYIDTVTCLPLYRLYAKAMGDKAVIEARDQMNALLEQEPYFVSNDVMIPELPLGRRVTKLDLTQLEEKGIMTSMFGG